MGGVLALEAQQTPSVAGLTATPRTRGVVALDPGTAISSVFLVRNASTVRATVVPHLVAPADWLVVTGLAPFPLEPGESDTWVISLSVPAHAARGQYVIPVLASVKGDERLSIRDSIIVEVKEHHEIGVALLDQPPFITAGDAYDARFLVRNAGNGPARIRVSVLSSRGAAATMDATELTLSADSARTVAVRVPTRAAGVDVVDDVLELQATDEADTSSEASASSRVTIVPKSGMANPFVTVPGVLLLRAAGPGAGVAPFVLTGSGRLRSGGPEQTDFLFRGPTGPSSPFGERDEYRVGITAPAYNVRLGDNLFGFSQLTNLGAPGFGAGANMTKPTTTGGVMLGAYTERFRFQPDNVDESGGSLSLRLPGVGPVNNGHVGVSVVDRVGGPLAGQIASSSVSLEPSRFGRVEAELAASRGPSGPGTATSLRLTNGSTAGAGSSAPIQYDVTHMTGTASFAGAVRGATHDYAAVSTQPWRDFQLIGSGSSHESTVLDSRYQLGTARLALSHGNDVSLAYVYAHQNNGSLASRDSLLIESMPGAPASGSSSNGESALLAALDAGDATQRGVAANVQHNFGRDRFWITTELGNTHALGSGLDRAYHAVESGSSLSLGSNSFGLYGERYDGGSITRGAVPLTLLGGNASMQLTRTMTLMMFGSGSLQRSAGQRFSQLDARLAQTLASGVTISVRSRVTTGQWDPRANQRVVFLESAFPLGVPVGLARPSGRVTGRIVSSETGLGVKGALVRLGPQAAITDDEGRVSFAGLASGDYRVSLSQDISMAGSAVDGDPTVRVDGTRRAPATFELAIAAAAVVRGTVHTWAFARTPLGDEPDSLVDAGPMRGVVVSLISGRDTLYRTTDETGVFQFSEQSPKHWTLKVVTAAPPSSHFDPEERDIGLAPGQVFQANVRLVPVHRKVRIIDKSGAPLAVPQAGKDSSRAGRTRGQVH